MIVYLNRSAEGLIELRRMRHPIWFGLMNGRPSVQPPTYQSIA